MNIYLIRHTAVDVLEGICYGQTDVALKDTFKEEATIVCKKIKAIEPDAVFSSPLRRCSHLADFCGFHNAKLDTRLKELNFGEWEGKSWSQIDMHIWERDWVNTPAPQGESFAQMYKRAASFFDQLSISEYNRVAIFTHAGVIRCAYLYFGQMDINKAFDTKIEYGEVVDFSIFKSRVN